MDSDQIKRIKRNVKEQHQELVQIQQEQTNKNKSKREEIEMPDAKWTSKWT